MLIVFTILLIAERLILPFYTYSLGTCLVGIIALGFFFYFAELSLERIGITVKRKNLLPSLLYGLLLPVASILIEMGLEEVVWLASGNHGLFFSPVTDLHFSTIQASSVSFVGIPMFLKWALGGILICLVRSVFYEFGFRGYFYYDLTTHFSAVFGNWLQAIGYTVMIGVPSAYTLIVSWKSGGAQVWPSWVIPVTIIALILNALILGVRQGYLREMTGSVWICVVCFLVFDYHGMIFKAGSVFPTYLFPFVAIYRSLAVQIIASIVNIPAILNHNRRIKSEFAVKDTREVDVDRIVADILYEEQRNENRQIPEPTEHIV